MNLNPAELPAELQVQIASTLSRALQDEACILTGRNSPEALLAQIRERPTIVLLDDLEPVGFATFWLVGEDRSARLYELGSVWLAPAYRHSGHSIALYRTIMRLRQRLWKSDHAAIAFSITTNPAAVRLGERVGFVDLELAEWLSLLPWSVTCEPCDLVAPEAKRDCERRCRDCRLRIIPPNYD